MRFDIRRIVPSSADHRLLAPQRDILAMLFCRAYTLDV
jgi:hypothetical protein